MHAADVTQTCLVFIKHSGIQGRIKLSELDVIGIYLGSIVHDFRHPGVNNAFLINSMNELATRYNDASVLESYHIAEAFNIIRSMPACDIFILLNKEEKKLLRKKMIDCVLSTDMSSHHRFYTMIKLKVDRFEISEGKNVEQMIEASGAEGLGTLQQELCSLVLHFCDIANPAKPFEIYKFWMNTVIEEFFRQGDSEKSLGIPISFLCDREKVQAESSQIGFIDGIVLPFAIPIVDIFPTLQFFIKHLNDNKQILKKLKEEKDSKEIVILKGPC